MLLPQPPVYRRLHPSLKTRDLTSFIQAYNQLPWCFRARHVPMSFQKEQQRLLDQLDMATAPSSRAALLSDLGNLRLEEVQQVPHHRLYRRKTTFISDIRVAARIQQNKTGVRKLLYLCRAVCWRPRPASMMPWRCNRSLRTGARPKLRCKAGYRAQRAGTVMTGLQACSRLAAPGTMMHIHTYQPGVAHAGLDNKLEQLSLPARASTPEPEASASHHPPHTSSAVAAPSGEANGPAASRALSSMPARQPLRPEAGRSPSPREVPFDGRHLLELHGLGLCDTTTNLDAFIAGLSSGPIEPVVRHAPRVPCLMPSFAAQAAMPEIDMLGVPLVHGSSRTHQSMTRGLGIWHAASKACASRTGAVMLVAWGADPMRACSACRWVTDATALAVFANPAQAQLALEAAGERPRYKLRLFSEVACAVT